MAPQFPALRLGEISPNCTTVYNIKINLSRIFLLFVMSPNHNADCISLDSKSSGVMKAIKSYTLWCLLNDTRRGRGITILYDLTTKRPYVRLLFS